MGWISLVLVLVVVNAVGIGLNAPKAAGAAALSQDEAVYVGQTSMIADLEATSLQAFSTLANNAQPGDATWNEDIIAQTQIWKALNTEVGKLNAPPRFQQVQSDLVQAFGLMDQAADDVRAGVTQLDTNSIAQATQEIQQATPLIQEAAQLITSMQ